MREQEMQICVKETVKHSLLRKLDDTSFILFR